MGKGLLGAPLIKKHLRTVQKNRSAQRTSIAAWGPEAHLRVPVGSPEALWFFNAKTAFSTQTYRPMHQIVEVRTLLYYK